MKPELLSNFQYVTDLWLQGEKLKAKSQLKRLVPAHYRPAITAVQPALNPRVPREHRRLLEELLK